MKGPSPTTVVSLQPNKKRRDAAVTVMMVRLDNSCEREVGGSIAATEELGGSGDVSMGSCVSLRKL